VVILLDEEGVMFLSSYRNEHGTGYDLCCTSSAPGYVDITIYQVIMDIVPDEPSVSLMLPMSAAVNFLAAFSGAVNISRFQQTLYN
jgi:hypothetical protein